MKFRGPAAGIPLKLVATLSFSLMYVFLKLAGPDVPLAQQMFFRCVFSLPVVFAVATFTVGLAAMVRTKRPFVHFTRALIGFSALCMSITAVDYIPLADLTAFGFVMPIFAVILAALILREKVGPWRWGAVLIGFAGVMLMCEPHGGVMGIVGNIFGESVGAALALGAAFFSSFVVIFVRQMNSTEKSETIVFYFMAISTILSAVAMLWWHIPLSGEQFLWLSLSGVAGGIGQVTMTYSYRFAEPSMLASFDFTSMIWATLFGYLLFQEVPANIMLIGAAIVIGAGGLIAWREHRQHREIAAATPSV